MWLFDTSEFMSRAHCGTGWTKALIYTDRLSNFTIFLSYFTIASILFYFWVQRRRYLPFNYIFIMFGLFILFCGLTHLCNVLVFDWPSYRLFVLVDLITSFFSVTTAIYLPFTIRHFLSFPSFTQLKILVDDLQAQVILRERTQKEYYQQNQSLKEKISELESNLNSREWIVKSYHTINELKEMLKKDLDVSSF